jgi:23S rRNA (pseudouridine1915-N3)-methyltransferase
MKIILLAIGKADAGYFAEATNEYQKRLEHYIPFEIRIIPDSKNTKNLTASQQKEKEGESILRNVLPGDYLVLLDDKGKEYTSLQFASYIDKKTQAVSKRLIFVIGGPYGFSQAVYQKADEKLTLSRMTFPHRMVRLIFTEQLYRAMTILNNEPYHHE